MVGPEAAEQSPHQRAISHRGRCEIQHPWKRTVSRSKTATKKRAGRESGASKGCLEYQAFGSSALGASPAGADSEAFAAFALAERRPLDFL